MRYGNTPKSVFPVIYFMFLFGCVLGVIGYILMSVRGDPWYVPIVLFLLPPVGIIAVLIPTFLFCIKLEDGYVKHVFLNRYPKKENGHED